MGKISESGNGLRAIDFRADPKTCKIVTDRKNSQPQSPAVPEKQAIVEFGDCQVYQSMTESSTIAKSRVC